MDCFISLNSVDIDFSKSENIISYQPGEIARITYESNVFKMVYITLNDKYNMTFNTIRDITMFVTNMIGEIGISFVFPSTFDKKRDLLLLLKKKQDMTLLNSYLALLIQ
jgi:hypothetical protein